MFSGLAAAVTAFLLLWQPFWIPSGSMKPALLPGDYLFALRTTTPPVRGEVVVFEHPANGQDFVKRVIAVAGDTVALQAGQVVLNGTVLPQRPDGVFSEPYMRGGPARMLPRCSNTAALPGEACDKRRAIETLPGGRSYPVLDIQPGPFDDTREVTVPEGHFFVLGDNRDNSVDSRLAAPMGVGFVPNANIRARAKIIVFSSEGALLYWPPYWREGRAWALIE